MKIIIIITLLILLPSSLSAKFMKPSELGLIAAPLTKYLNTNSITTLEFALIGRCLIVYSDGEKANHSYNSKFTCDELVQIIDNANKNKE